MPTRVTIRLEMADPMTTPPPPPPSRDLTRILLASALLALLIAGSFWVLQPFLPALIWATMIVVSTWPVLKAVQARLGGKRGPAAVVMTLLMVLVIVFPVALAVEQIVTHADDLTRYARSLSAQKLPPPPEWLNRIPLAGEKILAIWQEVVTDGPKSVATRVEPYAGQIASWLASKAGNFGMLMIHLLLTVLLTAILYAQGETAARGMRRFGQRVAGERGHSTVVLAGAAIRAVALGLVVTAFVQSVLGGIGLAIAGVPYAAVLTALMFILCLAQLGPLPVLLLGVLWLWWTDATGWAIFLFVWSVVVGSLDNFLRPALIKRGADLPLLLIMSGVIGGLLAFGIVGLFVGPVVLAVTYTLLKAWIDEAPEGDPPKG